MKFQPSQPNWRTIARHAARVSLWLVVAPLLVAQEGPTKAANAPVAAPASATSQTVLFIGNSFTSGYGSAVQFFRPQSVADLNDRGIGGVPALFKVFSAQAGLDFVVSVETVGGKGLDYHVQDKAAVIARPWDCVVMHGYSTLDQEKPGDPGLLVRSAKQTAELLRGKNPHVRIWLLATWSRADLVYSKPGRWQGRPIAAMAGDIRVAYDLAAAGAPSIRGVIPVGEAWNRAMKTGVADANPYDGISFGQVDLWSYDHYHASSYGYYLEALMVFGELTGLDPRSLGKSERAAVELGLSPAQASALHQVAYDELMAAKGRVSLQEFKPRVLPR